MPEKDISIKYYFAIPEGVLRNFVKQNADKPDDYLQLFELIPEHIYSSKELGEVEHRGTVIINGEYLPEHKEDKC